MRAQALTVQKMLIVLVLVVFAAVIALFVVLGPPLPPPDPSKDWVWKTDGKRWTRSEETVHPPEMPTTTRVDVPPGREQDGDSWRMNYVGKRMERVTTREVPLRTEEEQKGHVCSWRMRYVGKRVFREKFCIVDGVEHPYEEMHPGRRKK